MTQNVTSRGKHGSVKCSLARTSLFVIIFHTTSSMLYYSFRFSNNDYDHQHHSPPNQFASIIGSAHISEQQSLQNALTRIKARNAYLCTRNTDTSQWRRKTGGPPAFHDANPTSGQIISLLSPVITCPWTLHRTNYVSESQFDGGKWSCGLREMREARTNNTTATSRTLSWRDEGIGIPCIVYSFGSNGDDFFELDVHLIYPECEIHVFDPTSGDPPQGWEERYHFHKEGLCVGNATTFTLDERTTTKEGGGRPKEYPCRDLSGHMKLLGHSHVDILKADVEGMEWDLTAQWPEDLDTVGQMLLEFHFWVRRPFLPRLLRDHILPLEKLGYFIQTIEPVAAKIDAFEITFLNVNWNIDGTFGNEFRREMYPITPGVVL